MADPVAEARALLAAATPGPWWPSNHNGPDDVDRGKVWALVGPSPDRHVVLLRSNDKIEDVDWRANAALAAAAPELLARLCAEVERHRRSRIWSRETTKVLAALADEWRDYESCDGPVAEAVIAWGAAGCPGADGGESS